MKLPPSFSKKAVQRGARFILGTSIVVLAASPLTQAAINIFTHSASTSWANLSNWSLGHAPTSTDALEFTDPMANSTLDGSYTAQSLSFNTSNSSTFWNVDAGTSPATLNLTGGGTNALGGTALLAMGSSTSVDVNIGVTAGDAALTINFGSANGTISVAGPNSILTLGSHVILTGSAGITFSGLGIVNLSATNSYTGPTTVSNQSELDIHSALPASSAFTNNGFTRVYISGTNVLGSSLSGNGTLTFSPSQSITLPSATAYTGSISLVNGDTLSLGMSNTFATFNQTPASTINIGSGAVLNNSGAFFNTLNNLTIAGGELRATGGQSSTFPAYQLKGTVSVAANSSFTATGATNSFTGIQLGNNTAGGVTTFNFTQAGVSLSIANVLQDGENTAGTATVPSGLAVTGPGTLILTAANTYTGPTTISGGTLQLNNTLYNGGTTAATLTVNSGGILTLAGSNTFGVSTSTPATSLIVQSGGLVQNAGAVFNTFNNLTINGGTLQANGGSSATFPAYQLKGTVTVGGTGASAFTVGTSLTNSFTGIQLGNNTAGGVTTFNIANATASLSIAPALVDGENIAGTATVASGLTLTGAGTLTLAGANTYTGPTSIGGGNLVLGGSLYSVSGAGAIDVGSGGTLTFSHNDTFGNAIAVPASTITIEAGGLVTNSNAVFNTFNNLTLNGGELRANGGFSATFPAYSLKGTVTANGPVTSTITANTSLSAFDGILIGDFSDNGPTTFNVTNSAGTLSIAASLFNNPSESSSLTKTGPGTLLLTAANSYSGITTINGGTLSVSSLANGGSPSGVGQSSNAAANLVLNGGVLLDTGASNTTDRLFTLGTSGGEIDTSGAVTFTNTGAIVVSGTNTARALTLGGTGTGTLSGILGDNGTGASSLLKNGAGTWILTGTNTYTGLTTINAGTLQIGNGGTSGSIAGSVADNSALVFDRSDNVTYAGAITGTGSVVQMGTGVLSLTSTGNNYSGGTSVQAGVLAFNTLGTGSVSLTSGTELRALSNASLSNITLPSSGTATLSAVSAATFNVSNLTLSPGFNLVFGSAGNTGVVAFNGTGSSADPSATITVAFGTLLNQGLGPITGTVASTTVNAGGTLDVHDLNLTINNLLGSGNVTLGSQSATTLTLANANFGGVISGAGGVQIVSSTDVHFSGANTYTGPTNINSGNLWVDGSLYGVTGPGTINVLPGASLVLSHSDTFGTFTQSSSVAVNVGGVIVNSGASFNTFNNLTFNGGQLIANGGLNSTFQAFQLKGTVTVNDAATSTIVNAGAVNAFTGIQLGNNTAGGVTTFNVTDPNGVLQANCVFMDGENTGGTASVSSGLTKIGPGTLQLTAANTYTGVTTILGGTLSASSLANGGSPGGIGQTSNAPSNLILNGGTLLDTGGSDTTDRLFTVGTSGGEIDTTGSVTFTNTGAIALPVTNTARTLILGGTGTGSLAATLSDSGGGATSLLKTGSSTWTLNSAQTFTGGTTIQGGTLTLDFTQANSPLTNILAPASPLAITDATLAIRGSSSASNSQTFNHLTLTGGTFIQLSPGSGQTESLNIGTLTRNPGAVLALPYPPGSPGGIFYSGGTAGNLVTDSNGVPYIISGEDWAVKDPTNTQIVNGASIPTFYTSFSSLAGNALIYQSVNATAGTTQLSSLAITNSPTIALGNSALLTPGILTRSSSNTNTISGGTLGSPVGELVIYNNPASTLTLNTSVVDSGRQTALTKGGPGTLVMNVSPSYTGATTISGGQFNLNAAINTPSANVTIDGPLSAAPQLSMQTASSLMAANLYVGVNGTGSLINVPNFFMAQITIGQNLYIASGTGSTGTVTLQSNTSSGATASLNVGGNIYLATAPGSTGTLTLNYDTTVQATSIIGGLGNSILNFTGGIIQATPQTTELFSGIKQFNAAGYYDCIDTDGNNAVSISQPLTGNWTLAKLGIGTLTLSAADTTAIAIQAGTLRLDFSRSGAPLANILPAQDSLPVYNATLAVQGSNSAPVSQTFQSFSPYGATAVRVTSGTGGATTLNLGAINNPYNATVDFTLPANGSIQTSSGSGGGSILAANGYAYATVNGNDWAATDSTNTHIVAGSSISGFYTPATATSLSGNADVPAGVTAITLPSGPPAISSLRFNQPQSTTLTISDTLTAGGILITSAVGASTIQINGGTLQGGTSLSIIQDDTAGSVNISSSFSTVNVIKSGPGPATFSGSYNNWLFVFGGALTLSGTIQNSGTLRVDGPIESPSSVIIAAGASVNQSQLMLGTVTYGNCIQNGGSAQFGSVQLGSFPGSGGHGSGGSYTLNAGSLVTGPMNFNNASFVQNGGTVQASSLTYYFGATAQYTLNAGSLTLSSLSTEDNGFVQTGGTVTVTGGNSTTLNGPYSLSGSGILNTNGESINASFLQTGGTHTDSNSFTLNSIATGYTLSGSATLSVPNANENLSSQFIQNGGTNSAASVFDGATIPYALNGGVLKTNSIGGTFNLNGGTLRATGNASWFARLNVQAGGAFLDTNGFNASVGALLHDLSPATPAIDGGLTKLGAGILDIPASETYTGPTRIVGGSLQLDGNLYNISGPGTIDVGSGATLIFSHNDTFGNASAVPASTITIEAGGLVTNKNPVFNTFNNLIFNGGELRANGGLNTTYPAYSLKGTVTANGPVTSTITANTSLNSANGILIGDSGDNGSTTFNVTDPAGTLSIAPGLFDNSGVSGGLIKTGPGSLVLSGASTYSGPTQVNQGKVVVHGSLFGTANVNVGDGIHAAILSGNGTITPANGGAVTVASGATLAPDAGGLTINAMSSGTASLAFQANSTLQLSIANNQSSTQGAPALGDYSSLTLGTGVTASLAGLINIDVSGPVNLGDGFLILLSSTAVSGTFSYSSSALAVGPSTFRFTSDGQQWEINYAWTGNPPFTGEDFNAFAGVTGGTNVALLAVPEPSAPMSLLGGCALLLGWRRRPCSRAQ